MSFLAVAGKATEPEIATTSTPQVAAVTGALIDLRVVDVTRPSVSSSGVGQMDEVPAFALHLAAAIAARGDREVAGLRDDAASLEIDVAELSIRRLHFLAREWGSEQALDVLQHLPVDHWIAVASYRGDYWVHQGLAEKARMILFYLQDVGRQL